EVDVQDFLVRDLLAAEGHRLGVARDVEPVAVVELAREAGTAQGFFHRRLVVDADLDGRSEFLVEYVALVLLDAETAAEEGHAHKRRCNADQLRRHELQTPSFSRPACAQAAPPQYAVRRRAASDSAA